MQGKLTLSVDVEDWHKIVTRRFSGRLPECSNHVEVQTARVLDVLEANDVRGTFFVLGMVAKAKPELVRRIAARGHEIASHGISHVPLPALDRMTIRAELEDSKKLLSDIVGQDVVGYRAPEFSIMNGNRWVLDELARAGYRYDSSIYPIVHRRYGIASFPRTPVRLRLETGNLWELPLGTLPTGLGNLPLAGGGYFRLFPGLALETALRSLGRRGDHVMLYFHPYEFTSSELILDEGAIPPDARARARAAVWLTLQRIGRKRLPRRAERALRVSPCVRARDLVDALDSSLGYVSPSPSPSRNMHDVRN